MIENMREVTVIGNKVPCTITVKGTKMENAFEASFVRGSIRDVIGITPNILHNTHEGTMIIKMDIPHDHIDALVAAIRASVQKEGDFEVLHEVKAN